jgi:hypothetical protein
VSTAGYLIFLPDGSQLVDRRRVVARLVRLILRKETDLTELVSGFGAILWALFSAPADLALFRAVPGVDFVHPTALTVLLAVGGGLQLLAVFREVHRLRRFCALGSAATWAVIAFLLASVTGQAGQSAMFFVLAGAQSLAYVKMGQPARRTA